MLDLIQLKQGKPTARRCRPQSRGYAELRAQTPARPGIELLGRIRESALARDPDDGVELIYTEFDGLFSRGLFDQIDELLAELVSFEKLGLLHVLAIVSITSAARHKLQSRASFVDRVRAHLDRTDAARTPELLAGIE